MPDKIKENKNLVAIIYKLLNDLLLIFLIFFAIALVADGMLPGIITEHISFLKIIFLIALDLSAIYLIGSQLKTKLSDKDINKKTATMFIIFAALIIGNSLFKLNVWLAVIVTLLALIAGYYIRKSIFEDYPKIE
jgi:hypothetical protein